MRDSIESERGHDSNSGFEDDNDKEKEKDKTKDMETNSVQKGIKTKLSYPICCDVRTNKQITMLHTFILHMFGMFRSIESFFVSIHLSLLGSSIRPAIVGWKRGWRWRIKRFGSFEQFEIWMDE